MLDDYAFELRWNELPVEWRKEKIEEVRENLIAQETEHYQGEWEKSELGYNSPEEYTRQEIWIFKKVKEHIQYHFPVYF